MSQPTIHSPSHADLPAFAPGPLAADASVVHPPRPLKFGRDNEFQAELKRRVDEFFRSTGRRRRDVPQMYAKTVILLAALAASYVLLVFFAETWWQAVPLALVLGLATSEIGFNVQHDGGHHAYSDHAWVNKLTALTMDLIGGSSYMWHWKHVVYHHTYVNITGHDTDIDLGIIGRLTPHQKWYSFHRLQHFYLWPAYGLMAVRWHLYGDFRDLITGTIGPHPFPRPKGWDLVTFIAGKVVFLGLAFALPLMFHPVWVVAVFYAIVTVVLGIVLSVVFQLAHCVEGADFPMPEVGTDRIEHAWAIHQVETTVDFARRSHVVAWLLGGLNFQIEHHLLPKICHVNFPAISPIVQQTCREFGVKYTEHPSFRAGLASHYRWLRQMGSRASAANDANPV